MNIGVYNQILKLFVTEMNKRPKDETRFQRQIEIKNNDSKVYSANSDIETLFCQ